MEMEASRLQRRTLRSFMNAPSAQATFYAGETFFNQKKKATGKGDFLKKKEE
ncbi:hypothetical protein [Saccharibacillus kuerlensis]|nr:hypothetical protein [Saccharibacillus kuerlensis]